MSNRLPPVPSHITGELAIYLRAIVQRLNNESFVSQTGMTNTFAVVQPDAGGTVLLSASTVQLSATSAILLSGYAVAISGTSEVKITGNVVLVGSAVTSTSTYGFPQMPYSEATFTGTPHELGGYVPFGYDRVHHRFYVYDTFANAWRSVALT